MRTGAEIEQLLYQMVNTSPIKDLITGKVYLAGLRPLNSKLEDTVVIFQTSLAEQFQVGSVNINTYIPDVPFTQNGATTFIKNFQRSALIERAYQDFFNALPVSEYRFELQAGIQTMPYEANQHFVNMRIKFNYTTF